MSYLFFIDDYDINYIYAYKEIAKFLYEYMNLKEGFSEEKYVRLCNSFFKVEPIKWILDEQSGIAISEKILLSGVLDRGIENYLNEIFSRDIQKK